MTTMRNYHPWYKPWIQQRSDLLEAAAAVLAADENPSSHQIDMSDPKQSVDVQVDTSMDQMKKAVEVLETHFLMPDGTVVTEQDAEEIREALGVVRTVVDRVTTKAAAFSADRGEKPRSDRAASSYKTSPDEVHYHGSKAAFSTPRLSADGFFWLAPSSTLASMFAGREATDSDTPSVYEVTLHADTMLVDLLDLQDSDVIALREHMSTTDRRVSKDAFWRSVGVQFDFVERHRQSIIPFLTARGISGVKVKDVVTESKDDYRGKDFLSIGLWDLQSIKNFNPIQF